MDSNLHFLLFIWKLPLVATALLIPAWWVAGRLEKNHTSPFFRFLCAGGLALVGYLTFVNLLGKVLGNSIYAIWVYLLLNAAAGVWLIWRRPRQEFYPIGILSSWKTWLGPLLLACLFCLPQAMLTLSTPFWDEVASSAIHLTAPNQFAEGVFPPRHNALPHIHIKYHYAFSMLAGTMRWLFGVSPNRAIDVVTISLWLFIFLFLYFWFRQMKFNRLVATWGGFTVLLGGGLSWLYLPVVEAYKRNYKVPVASDLLHHYDAARGWLSNLIAAAEDPSQHLRNADGTLSNLPWDIVAQFQQHAIAMGMALTVVALYLFVTWQRQRSFHRSLLATNIFAFGIVFLGHAVFGPVSAVAAGTFLLFKWIRRRNWTSFLDGFLFAIGVSTLALLHGGMLTMGPEYGAGGFLTLRKVFGYSVGGPLGFLNWNLAGFGVPLLLTIVAWCLYYRRRDPQATENNILFSVLTVFAVFSYLVPQLFFYSSETYGVEQFTEISKFFFAAHFGFALLSAYGVSYLRWLNKGWILAPCFIAMALSPVAFAYHFTFRDTGEWKGFYFAPYGKGSIEMQMAEGLRRLKKTNHDVYFDASGDERTHHFLSEMLIFGGSVFTLTPSRYERTGVGFRLSEDATSEQLKRNSRVKRLLPGAPEDVGLDWYYTRPIDDMALVPVIVRSRFRKLVDEGAFVEQLKAGKRVLYKVAKPTKELDRNIEYYWSPKIVAQTEADCDGNGQGDLIFYDYAAKKIYCGNDTINLPAWLASDFSNLYVARFPGSSASDFLIGRMRDTYYRLGKRIDDVVEHNMWAWSYRDAAQGDWRPEYNRWFWDWDIPLVGDIDGSGFARHLIYRPNTGLWFTAANKQLSGPEADKALLPLPFVGRFLKESKGDLGLWTLQDGRVTIQSLSDGQSVSFRWGGTYYYILVPGDYDGDGRDEIGVYNQNDRTWYWKQVPDGTLHSAAFGTATSIPLPWDYDHDGKLDLAYWEPRKNKIYVSFNHGRSIDKVIEVPPHSIPAFVNMY